MQLPTKKQVIYTLTAAIAVIGIVTNYLQSIQGIVSTEYASFFSIGIILLGLAVVIMTSIIDVLQAKAAELKTRVKLLLKE